MRAAIVLCGRVVRASPKAHVSRDPSRASRRRIVRHRHVVIALLLGSAMGLLVPVLHSEW
jgi:hypothetical protein